MSLLVTDAVVLHAIDYLESSRILRLATREAGVQSVVARGARSSKKRFGSGLGLFAEGQAHIQLRPGRDLHTLALFDVAKGRPSIAESIDRFTAASAFSEFVMRVVHDENAPRVYQCIVDALDGIASASPGFTVTVALRALWRLVSEVGFTPALDVCAECHTPIAHDADAMFSHLAGGVLCPRCGNRSPGTRRLPAAARMTLVGWVGELDQTSPVALDSLEERAHQRLLREFLAQHVPDARPMRAYAVWENGTWSDT